MLPRADLVALRRTATLLEPGVKVGMGREELLELLDEPLDGRTLVTRTGGAVTEMAREAMQLGGG